MLKFQRVLLYIGAPKTGTTATQLAVWANRGPLRQHGVFVPRAGQRGVQHMDLPATAPNRLHGGGLDRHADITPANLANRRTAFLEALEDELVNAPPCHTLLMMSEYLFGATRSDIECFRELFAPHASRLECLMYLRRQDEWLASLALQARKAGTREDFELVPGPPSQFGANVRVWHGLADACYIRRFDPAHFIDGDLITDFRATLGVEKAAFPHEASYANPSIMQEQLELIDVLNRKLEVMPFHERIPVRRKFVSFCKETVGGTKIEFSRGAAIKAFKAYAGINKWLRDTIDPDGDRFFFPEDFSQYPIKARNDHRYDKEELIILLKTLEEDNAANSLPTGGWRRRDGRKVIVEALVDAFILMRQTQREDMIDQKAIEAAERAERQRGRWKMRWREGAPQSSKADDDSLPAQ
jgi:hypothetical protein